MACLTRTQLSQNIGLVFDAGATAEISRWLSRFPLNPRRSILTPHPGEWRKVGDLQETLEGIDDLKACSAKAMNWGTAMIFKSSSPIIFSSEDQQNALTPVLVDYGSARLARAGSGDVLAGIIAAHLSQDWDADEAAVRSLIILEHAARLAETRVGRDSILATDIIDCIGLIV
jgi:ADP-dependent NAD(P)H-hydrate dehydratase / NAD(P)H-hydrate epimerase